MSVSEHRSRGREGWAPASEPYPDVDAAFVHRLKDGDCFAFLHLSPNQVSTSGAGDALPRGHGIERPSRVNLKASLGIISYGRGPGKRTLRPPICSNDKIG